MSVNPATSANLGSFFALVDTARAAFIAAADEKCEAFDALDTAGFIERAWPMLAAQGVGDDWPTTAAKHASAKRRHRVALQRFHAARDAYESAVAAFSAKVADLNAPTK